MREKHFSYGFDIVGLAKDPVALQKYLNTTTSIMVMLLLLFKYDLII